MSNKFFGQYLLERGLLNAQQLLRAIDLQRDANPPIGQLAVRESFINESAATLINLEQQRTDKRFGELAISMGHMTEEQVSLLFHTQKEIRKFFGEIVVDEGYISELTLEKELAFHAELKKASITNIDSVIEQHQYSHQITETIDAIIKNFTRIPKIPLQIAQVDQAKPMPPAGSFIISQTMYVPAPIKVGWIMTPDFMVKLANQFLGIDVSNQEPVYVDAVSEFLNIVLGNALVSGGGQTQLDPPQVELEIDDYQGSYDKSFCLTMSAPQKDFTLFFMHD